MDSLKSLFSAAPMIALFLCVAIGYGIGKIRLGQFQLGGVVGTLFAAILIGQIGVETDETVKAIAFALFIYSLGYVSGPQFFGSLGRATLNQVHLAVFNTIIIFAVVWGLAQIAGLDKGTAAGLLAGATTESASVGTAGEALQHLGLNSEEVKTLEANIGVTYAVTYLFGFTLVVFFVSTIAPKLMGVNLVEAARAYEGELGKVGEDFGPSQEEVLREILVRVFLVNNTDAIGMTVAQFEHDRDVTIEQVVRAGQPCDVSPGLSLLRGDRVALIGRRLTIIAAGDSLGEETANLQGMGFVGETREVVVVNSKLAGSTLEHMKKLIDPQKRRGVYLSRLTRAGHKIELRPHAHLQAGDVVMLYGPAYAVESASTEIGYSVGTDEHVDYVYLGVGITVGILIGMISLPLAGTPVSLGTGGGCLLSGLVFGWLRSKHPTFGNLPAATALHLRDFGLALFVASVGLAVGPQAMKLLAEKGIMLPLLSITVVLVPLVISMFYARFVLKMNPILICGALAGVLTCTAGLNAVVAAADSETPVLGYTVPYAIANVLLTLLGPVLVLTV